MKKDSVIAGIVTIICVLLILLCLLFTSLRYDAKLAASSTNPELEEEELFLDPELMIEQKQDIGEPETTEHDTPAAEVKGEPVPAPAEENHTVHTGENKQPAPEQQMVSTKDESPVSNAASGKKKEEEKVAKSMTGKFSSKPGAASGKFDSSGGSDNSGIGMRGNLSGRKFLGCPPPDVELTHRVKVTVSIIVDSEGRVIEAKATGTAPLSIRKKCEDAARKAKWSAKEGAPNATGTIDFTIIPK